MQFKYPSYMRMSAKALRRHLIKRKTPELLREQIEEVSARQREERRVHRIKQTLRTQAWGELLDPLKAELKIARASLRYYLTNHAIENGEQCRAAFSAYVVQMERLMKNLEKLRIKDGEDYESPLTIARKALLPNDGAHWSDWLEPSKKAPVQMLFNAIPYKFKAKRKNPYERELSLSYRERMARKHLAKAETEREKIAGELHILQSGEKQDPKQMAQLQHELQVAKRHIVKQQIELRRVEDESRSKKQRDAKKQAAVQDAARGEQPV